MADIIDFKKTMDIQITNVGIVASMALNLCYILIDMHLPNMDVDSLKKWAESYRNTLINNGYHVDDTNTAIDGFIFFLDESKARWDKRIKW
uniref:Uncharacterized protein n=1 Tax=viral metagenome TaxID=1070528 RepID=A0A6M3L9B5_9ZZZZ